MDNKGQAYSVFKILIAAVVAGAILLILLQTLKLVPNLSGQEPNDVAAEVVKSQLNDLGIVKPRNDVTFNPGDSLNAKTIAENSEALSREQVCVLVSPNAPRGDDEGVWSHETGALVQYNGSSAQRTRLLIVCDRASEITTSIEDYGYEEDIPVEDCESFDGSGENNTRYCVVSVVSDI